MILVTTDASKGALRNLARDKGYRTFVVPDDVCGRFSVLTEVGLVGLGRSRSGLGGLCGRVRGHAPADPDY